VRFFVPGAADDESTDWHMAWLCGVPARVRGERVYSMSFVHDDEEWAATVGQKLSGQKVRMSRRDPQQLEQFECLRSPAGTWWNWFAPLE
jgi:hypothetical protein